MDPEAHHDFGCARCGRAAELAIHRQIGFVLYCEPCDKWWSQS